MIVIKAQSMGFCFGVRMALDAVRGIAQPEEVTINGELVHNRSILSNLARRGFRQMKENERGAALSTRDVLVTAHGISNTARQRLEQSGHRLIDTTCPLVRDVHAAARAFSRDGWFVVVIGRKNHVEVNGIVEDLEAFTVVENESEVTTWPFERIGVICQSTTPEWKAERIMRLIRVANAGREIRFVNTICRPTQERQAALEELARTVSVIVVVGGANSNNTAELVHRATSLGLVAHHVENARDLRAEWFVDVLVVGLTAGTSTPDEVVNEVEKSLEMIEPTAITRSCASLVAA